MKNISSLYVLFLFVHNDMSRCTRKPTICLCENKDADQLRSNCEADQRFVFATRIVHFLFFFNPKFQASIHLLKLHRPVCVKPGRKTEDRFVFVHNDIVRVSNNQELMQSEPKSHPKNRGEKIAIRQ